MGVGCRVCERGGVMNKQEAIEIVESRAFNIGDIDLACGLSYTKHIINQIDEPQKVIVPKFVAEWIKKYKEKGYRLSHALVKVFDDAELSLYIKQQVGDYTETIAKAWLTYPNITVEQEKLYTVEIPNPNGIIVCLKRLNGGKIALSTLGKSELTEAEIRKDFEWAWDAGFAKEVE